MRFRLGPDDVGAGAILVGGAERGDNVFSVVGLVTVVDFGVTPDTERVALAAYPEDSEFIVSCLVKVACDSVALPLATTLLGASTAAVAAACLSTLSLFFSSFVCSPGHSAGTLSWHLLWQVKPQSLQINPFAERPQMRSPQRSQFVGILNVSDLKV